MKILHKIKTLDCEIYVVLNFVKIGIISFTFNCLFFPQRPAAQTYSDQTKILKDFFVLN